jgi:hypothetical protein
MHFRLALVFLLLFASAAQAKTVKQDYYIEAVDPGIKLFVRSKMAEGQARFADDNIVLFEKPRFEFFNEIVKFMMEQP